MPATTVRNAVDNYLALVDRSGLPFDPVSAREAQSVRELKKKAHTILNAFLTECGYADESIRASGMGEMIRCSLREIICGMKRKSGEEYLIPNSFFAFLEDRFRIKIEPFERQLTPLERQLSIAKDLHDFNKARDFDRYEVARKYLVSERTIDSDMAALHKGISVFDQTVALEDFYLKNRKVTAISTMHPLFLTQNLTQVVCILEGLRKMEEDWTMRSYASQTAISIWCQLSDYARDRILGTLIDLMGLDREWYESIRSLAEQHEIDMFYNEKRASEVRGVRSGYLLYAFKGDLPCAVYYAAPDDSAKEIKGKVIGYDQKGVKIMPETGGGPVRIPKERILEVEVATELR